ncbi:hypothetical protein JDV02_004893 [Purpureocillium takamizusanense]|uniref:Uncharacterized protein n=1 Tax=Purpureocillium takamizusanense TaxID=2060973 RepID=A0A9Q8QET0_9HYPO|nr:uncharacterized protein JDV02_004893 [Purpureocillium takamizusanense]UNI18638.1 hypothetical protein JDV02_004893 [Purpureocillium takamizusanense]
MPKIQDAAEFGTAALGKFKSRWDELLANMTGGNEEAMQAARTGTIRVLQTAKGRLENGDADVDAVIHDAISLLRNATSKLNLNDVARDGLGMLRAFVDSHDLNKVFKTWLGSPANSSSSNGILPTRSLGTHRTILSAVFSRDLMDLTSLGTVALQMLRGFADNADLNNLAKQALDALGALLGTVDLNRLVGKTTTVMDNVVGGVNFSDILKRGLALLMQLLSK